MSNISAHMSSLSLGVRYSKKCSIDSASSPLDSSTSPFPSPTPSPPTSPYIYNPYFPLLFSKHILIFSLLYSKTKKFVSLFLVIPALLSLLLLLYVAYNILRRFKYNLPPGPKPWPIVGNIYDIGQVRCQCFHEWAQKYGPILSFRLGMKLNVVVSNAELAKQVLKENDQTLADRHRNTSSARFSKDGKDLIWADYGPHYVKVRKACTMELFTHKRLEALRPIREDEVTAMIESLFNYCTKPENKGKPLELRRYIGTVAFNNITRLTFGKRFTNDKGELDPLGKEFKGILYSGSKSSKTRFLAEHLPWLRWLLVPLDKEKGAAAMHNARLDRFTRKIVEDHTKAKSKNIGGAKQHFVDALLGLKDEYDLSEDTVIGLLWDMVIAGMDTVSISVEWAMAELIKNPRIQKKAQEELDQVIGQDRIMVEKDSLNLPYLQALAKESLRLHPPTPLTLPHKAKEHVKISGYDVPKGSIVYVNVWCLARDPNAWRDPLEFRPERFFEEDIEMKGHDFRLLPFGAGRRICPGTQLGIDLVTSMLGHLLHHFDWKQPNDDEIEMKEAPGIVAYMSTPLQAIFSPRLSAHHLYKRVPVDM